MPQCLVNNKQKRQMKRFNFYAYLQYCWYRTSRHRFCLEKLYSLECKSRKIKHALNNHLPYILEETKKIIIYHFARAWAGIHTDNELQVKLIVISEIRLKKKRKLSLSVFLLQWRLKEIREVNKLNPRLSFNSISKGCFMKYKCIKK